MTIPCLLINMFSIIIGKRIKDFIKVIFSLVSTKKS